MNKRVHNICNAAFILVNATAILAAVFFFSGKEGSVCGSERKIISDRRQLYDDEQ